MSAERTETVARRPTIGRWIAGITVLVVLAGLVVGSLVALRLHAVRSFRTALAEGEHESAEVESWGLFLADRGWLEDAMREEFAEARSGHPFDPDDTLRIATCTPIRLEFLLVPILARLTESEESRTVRRRSINLLRAIARSSDTSLESALSQIVPSIEAAMSDSSPEVRRLALDLFAELQPGTSAPVTLLGALSDADEDVRLAAVEALLVVEPLRSREAIPALTSLMTSLDDWHRTRAITLLIHLDSERRQELMPLVVDHVRDTGVSEATLFLNYGFKALDPYEALALVGWDPVPFLPALRDLLDRSDRNARRVADALLTLAQRPDQLPPAVLAEHLRPLLRGNRPGRKHALRLLAELGPEARCAVPEVILLLEDEDSRKDAEYALRLIDPDVAAERGIVWTPEERTDYELSRRR